MTVLAHLRKSALALPEVEEGARYGRVAFSVRGRGFVSMDDDGHVRLRLPHDAAAAAAAAAHPTGELLVLAGTRIGFRVPLADIDGKDLNALVRASWSSRAPKRLAAALAAAESSAGDPDGDLPAGIGRPATQALLGAGLTTLELVAQHTKSELLALHGVGPKAVRILSETLEQQGLALRA
ncbi:hypothetical protein [Streptomyces sp. BV286]|uniref:hypothetical protein n=1 Tax=Streptomyces sp. BV286 TaxID=2849672 RepID=UPI0020C5E876|nr:hypothetical protein [Streptomyces sp. BV286]